jgi:predicted DNA repair protein MutK
MQFLDKYAPYALAVLRVVTALANLLVSGVSVKDKAAQVRKYKLVRPSPQATNMVVKQLGTVVSAAGSQPNVLGGD